MCCTNQSTINRFHWVSWCRTLASAERKNIFKCDHNIGWWTRFEDGKTCSSVFIVCGRSDWTMVQYILHCSNKKLKHNAAQAHKWTNVWTIISHHRLELIYFWFDYYYYFIVQILSLCVFASFLLTHHHLFMLMACSAIPRQAVSMSKWIHLKLSASKWVIDNKMIVHLCLVQCNTWPNVRTWLLPNENWIFINFYVLLFYLAPPQRVCVLSKHNIGMLYTYLRYG